jgi:uncharacterized protein YkwD
MLVATVLVGLTVGATRSAAPAAATVPPRTALENSIDWTIKVLINTERRQHGLPPLQMDRHLRLAARRHNLRMAGANTMSHQLPGEPTFGQRLINAGYHWSCAGENIAWSSQMSRRSVVLLEKLMYNEKAPDNQHRLNLLSPYYKNVGVDVYMDRAHHKVWLTTDFGRR